MSDETEEVNPKAIMMVCLACAAVAIGVLVIDMQIAKNLARNAQAIDGTLRNRMWENEVPRGGGNGSRNFGVGYHPGGPVVGNPGMETGTNSPDPEIPMEGWDVFPVNRSQAHRGPGSRNLAVPESNGTVEPE